MVQQLLSCLPRIRSKQYLFILSRKSYLPLKLSAAYPQEKSSHKKNHAYLTDSEYFTWLLKKYSYLQNRLDISGLVKHLASSFW